MPKLVNRVPQMRHHKGSNQAYVCVDRKFIYLGRFGSPEARAAYNRFLAEWQARLAEGSPPEPATSPTTIAELLSAFMTHAVVYYRSQTGAQTGEAQNCVDAVRELFRLYQYEPVASFDSKKLKVVQQQMVGAGLSRSTINARVNRIKRVFRWGVTEKLVPESVYTQVKAVEPLLKFRTDAPEAPEIKPVAVDRVEAILPHLPGPVAAMVQVQRFTGCRAGEVLQMRGCDVDRSKSPWEYRPRTHKNNYREDAQERVIQVGPRAQAVLAPLLARKKPDEHLFDPRDAVEEAIRDRKAFRRLKVKPYYDRRAYAQAVYRGCDRAFPHPVISKIKLSRTVKLTPAQAAELKAWRKKHRWCPLQLRHAAATQIREMFGLEAAQAALGHAKMDTTEHYAEKNVKLARDVARATG